LKEIRAFLVLGTLIVLASCLIIAPGRAASANAVLAAKLRAFEVLGVHLGMTPEQVGAALAKHGYTDDLTYSDLCVNQYIGALRTGTIAPDKTVRLGGKCVYSQTSGYRGQAGSGPSLGITYCEDYPAHPSIMRAVQIVFNQPLQTEADAKAFRLALYARLRSRPTWEDGGLTMGAYCSSTLAKRGADCFPRGDFFIHGPGSQSVDPKDPGVTLSYRATAQGEMLEVEDRDFMIVHVAASNKAIEATRTPSKTPF
jgi:hypothetical protein